MKRTEALAIVGLLAAGHNGRALSDEQVVAFADGLADLDFGVAELAARMHAQSGTWMPSLAEFREVVLQPRVPDAAQAWGEVIVQVGREGWRGQPMFSHPAVTETVRAMGWQRICEEEEVAVRAHFMRLYEPVRARTCREALIDPRLAEAFEARWERTRGLDGPTRIGELCGGEG